MPDLLPCLLERKILPKVWGGRRLESALGIGLPAGEAVGETWEVYDRPEGSSAVRGGGTLRELMERDPEALLGRAEPTPGGYFPLLLKYIDAREALSVQVHPDEEQARAESDWGKNEAWLVLARGPDARIIRGLRPGVTRERLAAVAHTAGVEDMLWAFRPEPMDVVTIPAGTVHALGPDVVVFEIQQNSDVTYRLYDWGRPRETHVDKALGVVRIDGGGGEGERPVVAPEPIDEHSRWLVRHPRFRLRHFRVPEATTLSTEGSVKVLSVLEGQLAVGWHSGGEHPPLVVRRGDTVLVPASIGDVFLSPIGGVSCLWSDAGEGS